MRILYVCQRYGERIVGGSEAACRAFAEHLCGRGHDVHVLTSTAHEYTTWENHYAPGDVTINGVGVHRLAVRSPRTPATFGPIHEWMVHGPKPVPTFQQRRWADLTGPNVEGLEAWLHANAPSFDVVIFMTYMYATTTRGLPAVAGRVPTLLQPTAHDEPSIWIPLFETILRMPDGYLYFTPAERAALERRLRRETVGSVVGIGIDWHDVEDPTPFRAEHGLGSDRYLLYVGRVDPGKGTIEAGRFFAEYKQRNPSDLKLVVAGELIGSALQHPDIIYTGFLDERMKRRAMAGSVALLQPSYFESFSIVLCESWVQGRPALVQGRCEVLDSQVRRSRGGIPYVGFASFEAGVNLLLGEPELASTLGAAGREFVRRHYAWPTVLDDVEAAITDAQERFDHRRHHFAAGTSVL